MQDTGPDQTPLPRRWLHQGLHAEARQGQDRPPRCWVGRPGGLRVVLPGEDELADTDGRVGARADLVDRALGGLRTLERCCAWVVRPGTLGLGDVETAWATAARHAFARHDLPPDRFFVVGDAGWLDAASGAVHRWRTPLGGPVLGGLGGLGSPTGRGGRGERVGAERPRPDGRRAPWEDPTETVETRAGNASRRPR